MRYFVTILLLLSSAQARAQALFEGTQSSATTVPTQQVYYPANTDHDNQVLTPASVALQATMNETALLVAPDAYIKIGNASCYYISVNGHLYCNNLFEAPTFSAISFVFTGNASLPSCDSGKLGFYSRLNADNQVWYCDGTKWSTFQRVIRATASLDFPALSPCSTLTATVTGAVSGGPTTCSAQTALPSNTGIASCVITATNTVSVTLCNYDSSSPNPSATTFNLAVIQ